VRREACPAHAHLGPDLAVRGQRDVGLPHPVRALREGQPAVHAPAPQLGGGAHHLEGLALRAQGQPGMREGIQADRLAGELAEASGRMGGELVARAGEKSGKPVCLWSGRQAVWGAGS